MMYYKTNPAFTLLCVNKVGCRDAMHPVAPESTVSFVLFLTFYIHLPIIALCIQKQVT